MSGGKSSSKGSVKDSLCCCEYTNIKGERSHLMATFCDCEALDVACDRCLTCRGVPPELQHAMLNTCADRVRIPWCSGAGALQIDTQVILPIVFVPISVLLATLNFSMTVIVLLGTPFALLLMYKIWRKSQRKVRSKIFYVYGLTTTWTMFFVFIFIVMGFREVLLWEFLLLMTLYSLMMYALFHAKRDPGIVKKSQFYQEYCQKHCDIPASMTQSMQEFEIISEDEVQQVKSPERPDHQQSQDDQDYGAVGNFLVQNFGFQEKTFATAKQLKQEEMRHIPTELITAEEVTWVDSRPIYGGHLVLWCRDCEIRLVPRAAHCPLCNMCILGRDHHCVWIDSCVGANNHRSFMAAILFFIAGGCYGSHLTLTTVCTPEMYFNWFLFPANCNLVYTDFLLALSYVCALYTLMACVGMCFVFLNQVMSISQNLTGNELHQATRRGWISYFICAKNNVHNRGILQNWLDFIAGNRKFKHYYGVLDV